MEIKQTRDTLSDVYKDALRIRFKVFVEEQGVPFALEMESPVDEAMSVHFVLYDDKNAIGTVRLLTNKEPAVLQRMAILKEARGKGYAKQLLRSVLDFAAGHQLTDILLHAQLSARGLYEKFDFKPEGEIFEEAGIRHITMRKQLT